MVRFDCMLRLAPSLALSTLFWAGNAMAETQQSAEQQSAENAPTETEAPPKPEEPSGAISEDPSDAPPSEEAPSEVPDESVPEPVSDAERASDAAPEVAPTTPSPVRPTEHLEAPPQRWTWTTPTPEPIDTGVDREAEAREKRREQLPWRDSAVSWGHVLTTSAAGVGRDYLSQAHQVYIQTFSLLANWHLITREAWGVRAALVPEFELELTDSALTTQRRELWFADLPLAVAGRWVLAKNEPELTSTTLLGNWTTIFPTSKASRAEGDLVTLSPRLGLTQTLPLLGKGASWFSHFSLGAEARYDHLFSEATTPVNDDLRLPGQDRSGRPRVTDLLNGAQLAPNRARFRGFLSFAEQIFGNPTKLTVSGFYETARLHGVEPVTLELATGPVEVTPDPDARTSQPTAGVAVELGHSPLPEFDVVLGYANRADLDSENSNPLYTPSAVFLLSLSLNLDQLYLSATGY